MTVFKKKEAIEEKSQFFSIYFVSWIPIKGEGNDGHKRFFFSFFPTKFSEVTVI